MPNLSMILQSVGQSVTRPIIFDIISQVQKIIGIPDDTKIFFPGDIQKMQTPGTSIDADTDRFAIFGTSRYNFIDVEEEYDINTLGSTAVTRIEHIPVFEDPKLRVRIVPVYSTNNVTINFKYRSPSKSEVFKWRDDIRMRLSMYRDINLHDISYHFLIPPTILEIVKEIYDKREAYLPYGQNFPEYFTSCATDRLTVVGNLVDTDAKLAIAETQCRIVGIYNWDAVPEKPEREDDTGTWTASFSYKFTFEKPIGINVHYPVIVHNQLLEEEFITYVNNVYDLNKVSKTFPLSLGAMNGFESDTIMNARYDSDYLIRIPTYDDYTIPSVPPGTGTVIIALAEVDTTDKVTLFSLDDLGDIILDTDILDFIRQSEWPYICGQYQSILQLNLYRNDNLTSASSLTCDANLSIKATSPLDLRNQHRVRLSIVCDLTLLSKAALDRLRSFPKTLIKIIGSINELLKNQTDFVNLGDRASISELEFSAVYAIMTGYALDNGQGNNRGSFAGNNRGGQYYGPGRPVNNWPAYARNGNRIIDPPNSRQNSNIDISAGTTNVGGSREGPNGTYVSTVSAIPTASILSGLDPNLVDYYRKNRIGNNTVQVTGIVAIHRER